MSEPGDTPSRHRRRVSGIAGDGGVREIPIARPYLGEAELEAIQAPLRNGWLVQGPNVAAFEQRFASAIGVPHAVATTSCTTALHLALVALGARPGDEVIVPSFTWIATANAVAYTGARPVLCDVEPDTFNLAPAAMAAAVGERTVGLLPVHLFGRLADMDAVNALAAEHGLWVLEDAACAFGARRGMQHAGTFAAAGCFSFHPRKSITTGEGGMLVTGDARIAARARSLRDHGGSRSDLERHRSARPFELAEYGELGFNYRMTDFQGALGCAQLDRADWLLAERARLAARYEQRLAHLTWLETPATPAGETHGWQSFVVRVSNREHVMSALAAQGIASRVGTLALHQTELYRAPDDAFPGATEAARVTLALPLFPGLEDAAQDRVIAALEAAA